MTDKRFRVLSELLYSNEHRFMAAFIPILAIPSRAL